MDGNETSRGSGTRPAGRPAGEDGNACGFDTTGARLTSYVGANEGGLHITLGGWGWTKIRLCGSAGKCVGSQWAVGMRG